MIFRDSNSVSDPVKDSIFSAVLGERMTGF